MSVSQPIIGSTDLRTLLLPLVADLLSSVPEPNGAGKAAMAQTKPVTPS